MGAVFLLGANTNFHDLVQTSGIRSQWIDLISWCGLREECPNTAETTAELVLPPTEGADHILLDLTLHLLLGETRQLAAFGCGGPIQPAWVMLASAAGLGKYNLMPYYSLMTVLVIPPPLPSLSERLTALEIDLTAIDQAIPAGEKEMYGSMLPNARWVTPNYAGAAWMLTQVTNAEKSMLIGRQGHTHFLSIWEKI
jgi:hypothetical protein